MKISACMIVKNEEKNIERCINSYKDIVCEIIVVDTGSTDNTIKIAEKCGAYVFHYEWNNNFAAAKNYALEKAKGDWIIFLDADEYFDKEKVRNLPKILASLDKSYNSIACKMINIDYVTGKKLDEITHVRIFRNLKHIRYVNPIHEMLINTKKNQSLKAYLANENELIIYHTGYSIVNRSEKAKRNLQILLKELGKAKENPTIYQYLSDCYYGLEDYENAIKYARLFINSGAKFVGYNVKPHQNIIDSMLRLRRNIDDIYKEIKIALKKFPNHPSFHFYLANLLYDLKEYDKAYQEYKKTLELQEKYNDIEINSVPSNLYHVYYYMGVIEEYRNNTENAIKYFIKSLELEKYNPDCFKRLSFLISGFPDEEIILLINSLYNINDKVDLDFIVNHLVFNSHNKKILSYYINLRYKKLGIEDYWILYLLLINGKYDKTFNIALDCYKQDKSVFPFRNLAIISALLSGKSECIYKMRNIFEISVIRILEKILLKDFTKDLKVADKNDYLHILENVLYFGEEFHVDEIIDIKKYFDQDISYEVGNVLLKNRRYKKALEVYKHIVEFGNDTRNEKKDILFNIGYCYYKLGNYTAAIEWFLQAYKTGYNTNDILAFLKWSSNQIDDAILKNEINKITEDIPESLLNKSQ